MKIIKYGGNPLKNKNDRLKIYDKIKTINDTVVMVVSAFKDCPYSTKQLSMLLKDNYDFEMQEQMVVIGEIISALRVCNELLNEGKNATLIYPQEIGINVQTDNCFIQVNNLNNNILKQKCELYDVVVVPGFIAINQNNHFVSLNKGGSDLTAILIAKMLNEKEVYLYKDVLGLASIDPKLSSNFKLYQHVSYNQMQNISNHNNQLIQKEALQYANEYQIAINICHYQNAFSKTIISNVEKEKVIVMSYDEKTIYLDGYNNYLELNNYLLVNNFQFDYILSINNSLKIITSFNNEKELLLNIHNYFIKGDLKA